MEPKSETIKTNTTQCCDDSCCGGSSPHNSAKKNTSYVNELPVNQTNTEEISNAVHSRYSDIAELILNEEQTKGGYSNACCNPDEIALSNTTNREVEDDLNIPSLGSDKKLLSHTKPRPNETVVDFGSGPGRDLLTIANNLNDEGRFIGVDFSEKMIEVASMNAKKHGLDNVSFIQSPLDNINLENNVADLIISNCVINLVPNKVKTFQEAYRILKSGGRIVFSDYVLDHELDENNVSVGSYCGCFGNNTKQFYIQGLKDAGFKEIETEVEYSIPQQMGTETVTYHSTIFKAKK